MGLTGPGIALEQPVISSALGIQFWDAGLDKPVTDGLNVTAQLANGDYEPVSALRTASGNYAFHGLPCLHDVEYPGSNPAGSSSPPRTFPFIVTVEDGLGRYLPMLFGLDLPLPYTGLFLSKSTGSPATQARAYLFSAPTRAGAPGVGVVRADLQVHGTDDPAAHAALKVTIDGKEWVGIADDQGRALVQFPSPLVNRLSLGSPPGTGQGPPTSMSWPVQVEVFYQPEKLRFSLAGKPDVVWPWITTPSLKSIVDEQQPAQIWQQESGPPVAQWSGNLIYGEELVLRTALNDPSKISSVLIISEGTSSP